MSYPSAPAPGPAPAPAKKVGIGGCLISIALVVLSGIAFFALVAWATVGLINDLQSAPGVPVGETGTVNITSTGDQFVFLGNFDEGGRIPSVDPDVTITDPDGEPVTITAATSTSSGSSSSGTFRTIGEFDAKVTGEYTVSSEGSGVAAPGAKIYATNLNLGGLGAKILIAVAVGGLLFLAAIIVGIIWLVRRSKAKKTVGPPPAYPPTWTPPAAT